MGKGKMGGQGGRGADSGMGKGGQHGGTSGSQSYTFTFSTDNSSVVSQSKTITLADGTTSSKALTTTGSTFVTTVGTNDKGTSAVVSVAETHTDSNAVISRTYADQDGDGQYTETFDLSVATVANSRAPVHQFTFNTDGTIATDAVVCRNQTRSETIDSNEVYAKVVLNGDTYVTKTTSGTNGYEFQIFRDDNADGSWTEVAHGHSSSANIDATTHAITLTGIQTQLAAADAITG